MAYFKAKVHQDLIGPTSMGKEGRKGKGEGRGGKALKKGEGKG